MIPDRSLLFAPPHMKLFDYGVPKASWGGAFVAAGVDVSGALFFLLLHCPPQIQLWQLWGIPSTRVGLLLYQSPDLGWLCVWWLCGC